MIALTNYRTVNKRCYDLPEASSECEQTLKGKIETAIYPSIGTLGIAYQLYLLLFG